MCWGPEHKAQAQAIITRGFDQYNNQKTSIKLSIGLKLLVAIIHRIFTEPAVQSNGFQMVGLGGAGRVRMILKAWK